jgi:CRISPR/Cas system CSM-associated protein Csm3 (group 7 of RAMP superfamily)
MSQLEIVAVWKVKAQTAVMLRGGSRDNEMFVDGQGRVGISGTTLAGFCRSISDSYLWGSAGDNDGVPSKVKTYDAIWFRGNNPIGLEEAEIRDGVSISRITGAAEDKKKFQTVVIPRHCTFDLKIKLLINKDEENDAETILSDIEGKLKGGACRIGSRKSSGMGSVSLIQTKYSKHDLNDSKGFFSWCLGEAGTEFTLEATPTNEPKMEVSWTPKQTVMVKVELPDPNDNKLYGEPQRSGAYLVIPGTSIKGAIRSRAEYILNTLFPVTGYESKEFSDQISSHELIDRIFGKASSDDPKEKDIAAAAISINDCYSRRRASDIQLRRITRNSIDRWTGGAADMRLFTVKEPEAVEWDPITIFIDHSRLDDSKDLAYALLYAVFRDMRLGFVPLGMAKTRGFGDIAVHENPIELTDSMKNRWKSFTAASEVANV